MRLFDAEPPPGLAYACFENNSIQREVFFSTENGRGDTNNYVIFPSGRWNNSTGNGWYLLSPLNLIIWDENDAL